jgi:hypothetical protein
LSTAVVKGLLKYWPKTNSMKEVSSCLNCTDFVSVCNACV